MSRERPIVLVVEDEQRIAQILMDYLRQAGFDPLHAGDGALALSLANSAKPDLILLDVMLPVMDGLTVCREIRKHSAVPIIMASARVEELDRLLGLELGADDYICKPFSPREVVARVKAVLRRVQPSSSAADEDKFSIEIDSEGRRAAIRGQVLDLTRTEFKLLELLSSRPGRVYSRAQILELAYDDEQDVSDRVIDSHIKNLRRKIADRAGDREVIRSVYGLGYRYEV
jgi:two-component system response regulator BaeR